MGVLKDLAKSLEFDWEWAHLTNLDARPFGSFTAMILMTLLYLLIISVFSYFMASRRSQKPPQGVNVYYLSLVHNLVMCLYSFYALIGTSLVLMENWSNLNFSLYVPMCDPKRQFIDGYDFWMYTFYLSKFLEFLDSILLLLRAKPLFPPANSQYLLHVFHHTVTASIVWVAWRMPVSGAWTGPWTNSFVHTFMYGYYFLTDLGMDRRYGGLFITPIQIIQFIFCIALTAYEVFNPEECGSSRWALGWMWFTYVVFLGFFIKLYFDKKQLRNANRAAAQKTIKPE